ncbi:MAG TPA: hypothetical protein VMM15_36620 [Bradyrhizobium sp.]|nr:hypothetical protein [Bradyrhizobium sp.]
MAMNMAQKRAKKAQRRKEMVAQKRRVEAQENGLPARVARAAQAPIQLCTVNEGLFEVGMGTVVLARGGSSHHLTVSVFLIDTLSLGIKDVMFAQMEAEALERYMQSAPMVSVEPSYARKLLRDLAAWSQSIGFAPHRDFAGIERIFGDVNADDSDAVFKFGHGGKPVYVSGPSESAEQVLQRSEQVLKYLGDDPLDMVA